MDIPKLPNITLDFEQILEENEALPDRMTYKIRCVYNGVTYEKSRNIDNKMKLSEKCFYFDLFRNGMMSDIVMLIRFDFPKFLIENEL